MRKLINSFIGVALVIIIALLVLPLGMSFWLKNHYSTILARLSQAHHINLKLVNFDRGWFASGATIQVTLPDSATKTSPPIQFTIAQRILNGPFIFNNRNHHVKFLFAKALVDTASKDPQFTFHSSTLLHFNNSSKSRLYADHIDLISGQERIVLKEANLKILYNPSTQRLISDATIKSALISEQQKTRLALNGITWRTDLHHRTSLWEGKRSLALDEFTYYLTPNQPVKVKNFTLKNKQSVANDTTAFTFASHADSVKDDFINLAPVDVQFSLNQMNTSALVNLINAALNLNHPLKLDNSQLHQLYPSAVNLLAQGLETSLDQLTFGTKEGQINLQGQLHFSPQSGSSTLTQIMVNSQGNLRASMPITWLKKELSHIYADKKVEIDNQALTPEQIADQQIQYWINNKKLIRENQGVKLTINYDKGKLLVNHLPSVSASQQ